MNNTQFGENTLYVQRMFSTMSPSYYSEYQEDEVGVDTRNFGILGKRVKEAAEAKYDSLYDADTPKLKRRKDRMRTLTYDPFIGEAQTNKRTYALERYFRAKRRGDTWFDYAFGKKSMREAPQHIQDENNKWRKLWHSEPDSPEEAKQEEKVNNMFLKWHYGVPDYVPEKEGWSKPSPTPPPYNPGKETSSPTPPKEDSFGKRAGKKLLKLLWNPHW